MTSSCVVKRHDGRPFSQLRTPFLSIGVTNQARGSSYVEVGSTKVMCSVIGPKPYMSEFSEAGRIRCEFRRAPFARKNTNNSNYARNSDQLPDDEKENSFKMEQALELSVILDRFPKSQVEIYAEVLESNDCDDLAIAITAASLALCDAGIELYDLVAACSVSMGEVDGNALLDPTDEEIRSAHGHLSVAYMSSLQEITHLNHHGETQPKCFTEAMNLCVSGCVSIRKAMEECLLLKHMSD